MLKQLKSLTLQILYRENKLAAINDYLSRKFSLLECCEKYSISSDYVLRSWISKYNGGKELKATNGGSTRMKARRKTTSEERLEIALYAIEHDKNYSATAKKYLSKGKMD